MMARLVYAQVIATQRLVAMDLQSAMTPPTCLMKSKTITDPASEPTSSFTGCTSFYACLPTTTSAGALEVSRAYPSTRANLKECKVRME